jgi:hypothetical protein
VEFLDQTSACWCGNSRTDPPISSIRHQLVGAGIPEPTVLWNSLTRRQLVGPEIPEPTTRQRVVEFLNQTSACQCGNSLTRCQLVGGGIPEPTVLWNSLTRHQLVGPEISEPTHLTVDCGIPQLDVSLLVGNSRTNPRTVCYGIP